MKASVRRLPALGVALTLLSACASNPTPPAQEPTADEPAPPVAPPPPPPAPTASAPPASPPPAEDPGPPPGVPSDPVELFTAISKMRPFNSQFIDFEAIAKFVNYYAALDGSANVRAAATEVRKMIRIFNDGLALPTGIIQLYNFTTSTFKGLLKRPEGALISANTLSDIVQTSGALYQQFIVAQQSRLSPDDLRAMQQQVAPGGPELTNISTFNRLKFSLQEEAKRQR